VGEYPVQELTDGTHSVTIPAGVPLTIAPEEVEIEIKLPGRGPMSPIRALVTGELDQGAGGGSAPGGGLAGPAFESLSPTHVLAGAGDTTATIGGTNLAGVTMVRILGADDQWHPVETTARTPTSLRLTIPTALLATAGFLQVSPFEDSDQAVAFLVAARGLPALGSATEIQAALTEPDDLRQARGTVSVVGTGFTEGMSLVLGRGATRPALPTTLVSEDVLRLLFLTISSESRRPPRGGHVD
jgi:hypothetical protein